MCVSWGGLGGGGGAYHWSCSGLMHSSISKMKEKKKKRKRKEELIETAHRQHANHLQFQNFLACMKTEGEEQEGGNVSDSCYFRTAGCLRLSNLRCSPHPGNQPYTPLPVTTGFDDSPPPPHLPCAPAGLEATHYVLCLRRSQCTVHLLP